MTVEVPDDSGLDLSAIAVGTTPQTRDPTTFVDIPRQRRLRFWRRSEDSPWGIQDPALWGALKTWFKFDDGTGGNGATIVDSKGLVTNMTLTVGDGGAPLWGTAGAFQSEAGAGSYAAANYAAQAASTAAARTIITSQSFLVEVDCNPTAYSSPPTGWNWAPLLAWGRANSAAANDRGFKVRWGTTSGANGFSMTAYGDTGGGVVTWNEAAAITGRRHLAFLMDRDGATTDTIQFFHNGVLVATPRALASAPGNMNLANNVLGRMAIGWDTASEGDSVTCTFYNARIWAFSAVPANIVDLIAELAADPDRLPDGLSTAAGVS